MQYIIGVSHIPIKEGTSAEKVWWGKWDTINADNKSEAAKSFYQRNNSLLQNMLSFYIYMVDNNLKIYMLDYCLEEEFYDELLN